ncbi:MAG: hypothetical protein M1834_000838 [Cirrosporium novae-zelandiae]|nr:MAG: hypothetical protein M1834_000838 [Cirrosporium novae-zelandiae]
MASTENMETYEARLASFKGPHSIGKRRASHTKGKSVKWPHTNPSPQEMARAGFFYRPTAASNDNVACFICRKSMDGWEEDDMPIIEHLKHSPDCGWAINLAIEEQATDPYNELDDPMSEKMIHARKETFRRLWPHDNKRGWACKTEKMVEAGWYYAPTQDSDDFVTCAYCKLSLDGWEPKDDPFEEHQRRSPDCIFFSFTPPAPFPKVSRGKKGRSSKASRLSTQSNITTASEVPSEMPSEAPSILEGTFFEDSHLSQDVSVMNISTMGTKKKGSRAKANAKGTKGKGSRLRAKREDPSEIALDDGHVSADIQTKPSRGTRGKKRASDQISPTDESEMTSESTRPAKRQSTRKTRSSVVLPQEDIDMTDAIVQPKTRAKGGKKRSSSATRKVSATSTASEASLRSAIPNDEEIDAALEADLERYMSDKEESEPELKLELVEPQPKRRGRPSKTGVASKKTAASVAHTRKVSPESPIPNDEMPKPQIELPQIEIHQQPEVDVVVEVERPTRTVRNTKNARAAKAKGVKGKTKKPPKKQIALAEDIIEPAPVPDEMENADSSIILASSPALLAKPMVERANSQQPSDYPSFISMGDDDNHDVSEQLGNELDNSLLMPNNSMITTTTAHDDSGHETDASIATNPIAKNISKKMGPKTKRGKKVKGKGKRVEVAKDTPSEEESVVELLDALDNPTHNVEPEYEQEVEKSKKSIKGKRGRPNKKKNIEVEAQLETKFPKELEQVLQPVSHEESEAATMEREAQTSPMPSSPPILGKGATLSPTPQLSDAENQPPSSLPTQNRPPIISPPRPQTVRIPLATTPKTSPSKRNIIAGGLQSSHPWRPVDLETVLLQSPRSSSGPEVHRNEYQTPSSHGGLSKGQEGQGNTPRVIYSKEPTTDARNSSISTDKVVLVILAVVPAFKELRYKWFIMINLQ